MKTKISERLEQAETAASVIRYAAELSHTSEFTQDFLKSKAKHIWAQNFRTVSEIILPEICLITEYSFR